MKLLPLLALFAAIALVAQAQYDGDDDDYYYYYYDGRLVHVLS